MLVVPGNRRTTPTPDPRQRPALRRSGREPRWCVRSPSGLKVWANERPICLQTTSVRMAESSRRYSFQPLERRGVLLGLGASQIACILLGIIAGLITMRALPGAIGAIAGTGVAAGAAVGALISREGLPIVSWAPIVGGWSLRRARGTELSTRPVTGDAARSAAGCSPSLLQDESDSYRSRSTRSPNPMSLLVDNVDIIAVDGGPGRSELGVVCDSRSSTLVGVIPVSGGELGLLDPAEQADRLDAWRAVLSALARPGGSLHRLQWVERSMPSASTSALPTQQAAPGFAVEEAARQSYLDLLRNQSLSRSHQVLISVAVAAPTRRGRPRPASIELLCRELRLLEGQLMRAELQPGPALGADEMRRLLAGEDSFAPHERQTRDTALSRPPGSTRGFGPMATSEGWSSWHCDDGWHATYWIAEWPRIEVSPDFLTPLLIANGRRAVSVVMAPVPLDRAIRHARSARTADMADEEIRSRAGFLPSARRRREADGATIREDELAAGHAEFRFSGFVTVSAASGEELAHACAETEQSAQECHLQMRRLYGRQAEAYAWTLPLARGLA
jgi:hypothetical protein